MSITVSILVVLALTIDVYGDDLRRDQCFEFVCMNGGRCTLADDSPHCECPNGYTGNRCQYKTKGNQDNCGRCPYDQVCIDTGIRCIRAPCPSFVCVANNSCGGCPPGKKCELRFPPCPLQPPGCIPTLEQPCIRPQCRLTPVCVDDAKISRDPCATFTCQNGGTCTAPFDSPMCQCPPGFFGDRCEFNRDPCFNFGCLNGGTCNAPADAPFCECPPGYTGDKCQIDNCGGCPYGQVCIDTGIRCIRAPCPSFVCVANNSCGGCPPGKKCELLFPPCAPPRECDPPREQPCERPVCRPIPVCVDDGSISKNPCATFTCLNGGTCTAPFDSPICQCPLGFVGDRCEFSIDPCFNNFGCLNGGTCNAPADAPFCECPPGFTGDKCQTTTDECGVCPTGQVCQPTGIVCKKAPCPSHACVTPTTPAVCTLFCIKGLRCVVKPRVCPRRSPSCSKTPVAQCVPIKLASCPRVPYNRNKSEACPAAANCSTDADCNINQFERCCNTRCGIKQCTVVPVIDP